MAGHLLPGADGVRLPGEELLPVIGLLWNPRLLPFLYLLRLMLMMVGIVELVEVVVRGTLAARGLDGNMWKVGAATAGVVSVVVLVMELFLFQQVPGGRTITEHGKAVYAWGIGGWNPITLSPTAKDAPERRLDPVQLHGLRGPRRLRRVQGAGRQDEGARRATRRTAAAGRCGRTTATTASTARRWR